VDEQLFQGFDGHLSFLCWVSRQGGASDAQ